MRALLCVLTLLVLAAGCGSSSSSNDALRTAVQRYSDAYLTGDAATSYELLSTRCQKRMGRTDWDHLVSAARAQYGKALPVSTFAAKVSGDLARATYTYADPSINQTQQPWVRENGQWHDDNC